jgi:hypothetical protein
MLNIEVKKIWAGKYASIREPQLKKAISSGGLIIKFDNKHMILNKNELMNLKSNTREFKSKFGNKPYRLIDIVWKPSEIPINQLNLI